MSQITIFNGFKKLEMPSVLLESDKDFLGLVGVWLLTVLFVQTDPESGQPGFRGTIPVKTQLNFCFACSKTAVTLTSCPSPAAG